MQIHLRHLRLKNFQSYKEIFNPMSFDPLQLPSEDLEVHWDFNSQGNSPLGNVSVHSFTLFYIHKT
jgi:hypothetical protein